MTRVGELRKRYALAVEPAPSRFSPRAYRAWAARADAWANAPQPLFDFTEDEVRRYERAYADLKHTYADNCPRCYGQCVEQSTDSQGGA